MQWRGIKQTIVIRTVDKNWFYKINKDGLCINKKDLHMIMDDPYIPKDKKNKYKRYLPFKVIDSNILLSVFNILYIKFL